MHQKLHKIKDTKKKKNDFDIYIFEFIRKLRKSFYLYL